MSDDPNLDLLRQWIHEPDVPTISADDIEAYLRSCGTPKEQE